MAAKAPSAFQGREFLLVLVPLVLAVIFAFWFTYQFVTPAPPSQVVITTGSETGGYYAFAQRYKATLKASGIDLEVRSSKGSIDNLERLDAPDSDVSLALLQGGISNHEKNPDLVSLGRVFLEPVWVFYKGDETLERVAQLAHKRIAIGAEGSGTRALAQELLQANDIGSEQVTLLPYGGTRAVEALKGNEADVIFLVVSPKSKVIGELLDEPDIKLMSFKQADAYNRLFPYLSKVVLPAGVIDLRKQVPEHDVTLLAAQAVLVAMKDTHPAIVGLMVEAAKNVHKEGGIFQRVEEFPKPYDPEYPMQEDAERLYKQGPPFLQRFLPFWLANFIERSLIMIVPIATILLPLVKVVPWLYEWRIKRRILYWYGKLKSLERDVNDEETNEKQRYMSEILEIQRAVAVIPVPLHYSDKLYELRGAVDLVRQRIAELS